MRLINIDELKGCAIIRPHSREDMKVIKSCGEVILHNEITTAYDIDNKVRQLEAWKEKQLAIADREIAESDSELRKGIIKELKAITDACIENSIKIVKGGQNERSVESC